MRRGLRPDVSGSERRKAACVEGFAPTYRGANDGRRRASRASPRRIGERTTEGGLRRGLRPDVSGSERRKAACVGGFAPTYRGANGGRRRASRASPRRIGERTTEGGGRRGLRPDVSGSERRKAACVEGFAPTYRGANDGRRRASGASPRRIGVRTAWGCGGRSLAAPPWGDVRILTSIVNERRGADVNCERTSRNGGYG